MHWSVFFSLTRSSPSIPSAISVSFPHLLANIPILRFSGFSVSRAFFFRGDRWQIRAKEAKKIKVISRSAKVHSKYSGWFVGKSFRINAWYHFHFIVHSPRHDQRGRIYMKLYYTSQMFIIIAIIITISCQIIIIFRNCLDAPCIFTESLDWASKRKWLGQDSPN